MFIFDKIKSFFENLFNVNSSNNGATGNNAKDDDVSIFDKVKEENGVNGKIDEPVYQGDYGDCWLLSGVLSMSYAENSAEKFSDSMSINSDGSVDITFDGNNKTYNVSKTEIDKNNKEALSPAAKYSTGDDDMLAVELAVDKMVADDSVTTKYSIQDGGNPYYVYKMYQADAIAVPKDYESFKKGLDKAQTNPNQYAMTFGIVDKAVCGLKLGHSYAVKDVTDKTITAVDPWNSTEEIVIDKQEFINSRENISMVYAEFSDSD